MQNNCHIANAYKCIIIYLGLILVTGCFGKSPVKTGLEGKAMPSFDLLLMDSASQVNTKSIPTGQPVVFIFISPDCPFCKAQTEEVIKNIKSLEGVRLYIVTSQPFQPFKEYSDHYKLNKYPSITVAHDFSNYFPSYYKVNSVPYIAIYNKEKVLMHVLSGKVDADIIKDLAFQ